MALTQRSIETALKADRSKRFAMRDHIVRGLILRVGSRDAVWMLEYRPPGRDPVNGRRPASRGLKLGNIQTLSLTEARSAAGIAKNLLVSGKDPVDAKKEQIATSQASKLKEIPCATLLEQWSANLRTRGAKKRHLSEEPRQVEAALRSINMLHIAPSKISKAQLLDVIHCSPPGSRKARFGALTRFLKWCTSYGYIQDNPAALIGQGERPSPPAPRDRWLTLDELTQILNAISEIPVSDVLKDLLIFIIATACRRNEAASARWEHIDMKAAIWRQPSEMTKNGRSHDVPLNETAIGAIERRLQFRQDTAGAISPSDLVFPSPQSATIYSGWSKLKQSLDRASGVRSWTLHDFRRTFASHCAENGVPEEIADLILNHVASGSRGGVLAVYQRSIRWKERVMAMALWGTLLENSKLNSLQLIERYNDK